VTIALVLPEHGIRAAAASLVWDEQIGLGYRADVEAILHGAPPPDQVLGLPASIVVQSPGGERSIAGIVTRVEHRPASGEDEAVALSIGPVLAPLAHHSDIRIFEHRTTLEIAAEVLADWSLKPELRCDVSAHPKLEYRVQYEESHLGFLRRILEEEGISLVLEPSPDGPERIVLDDAPWMREPSRVAGISFLPRGGGVDGRWAADGGYLAAGGPAL
jgi:type VI secretion system secreted protein VgrG